MQANRNMEMKLLDVGCGSRPKGDVNVDFFLCGFNPQTGDQIKGEYIDPKTIKNFILADAKHLPFKNESFNVVFSNHTIEHVQNPFLMLQEMCRVAKRKVVVRCPHRRGIGAVMPYHINYLDENWFKKASNILGVDSKQFITSYDPPFSSKLEKKLPNRLQTTILWRGVKAFDRRIFRRILHIPFEMEVWIRKTHRLSNFDNVKFVVVYNNPITFKNYFASSPYVSRDNTIAIYNLKNEPLPTIHNYVVKENLHEDVWFAFCHQDFILNENLQARLKGKDREVIYGPIGVRYGANRFFGKIIQTDETPIGCELKDDTPVQTLDEMCLIANSEVFRQGLSFDERFRFHFYVADLCMQAYTLGFNVLAMQLKCQHKSRTLTGDITSPEYLSSLNMFREKWKEYLPIRTTTTLLTE